jgi:hypothetical protein
LAASRDANGAKLDLLRCRAGVAPDIPFCTSLARIKNVETS